MPLSQTAETTTSAFACWCRISFAAVATAIGVSWVKRFASPLEAVVTEEMRLHLSKRR